jgi:uncharacterized protein (UPF0332 family)
MVKYDDYKAAANRSYYAVFSAMRAVLALDGLDFKKHSGVIAEFRKSYIKTGVFSTELSRIIDSLKDVRQSSDYDDFYLISKEEIAEQVEDAGLFVNAVSGYLAERYKTE